MTKTSMKYILASLSLLAIGGCNLSLPEPSQQQTDFSSTSFEDDDFVYTSSELDGALDERDLTPQLVLEELNAARLRECTDAAGFSSHAALDSTALFMHDLDKQNQVDEDIRKEFRSLEDVSAYHGWQGVAVQGLSIGADDKQLELGPRNLVNRIFGSDVAKTYVCDGDYDFVGMSLGYNATLNSVGYLVLGQLEEPEDDGDSEDDSDGDDSEDGEDAGV